MNTLNKLVRRLIGPRLSRPNRSSFIRIPRLFISSFRSRNIIGPRLSRPNQSSIIRIPRLFISSINNQPGNDLSIPSFSDNDDWSSIEIQHKFEHAMKLGLCYWDIPNEDILLYQQIKPLILSFFESTKKWPISIEKNEATLAINDDIDLEYWQKEYNINYGYVDRISATMPIQAQWFAVPFMKQNDIDFMKYKSNPFKDNNDVIDFGNNMVKHCQFILDKIFKYLSFDDNSISMLMGKNPAKHMLLSYYDPFRTNNEIAKYAIMEHYDFGFITLVFPDSKGFQIKYDGNWIDVPNYNNKYVVTLDRLFEFTTNGKVRAAFHRVKKVEDEVRTTISMYYDPDIDGDVYKYDEETNDFEFFKTMKQHFKDSFDDLYIEKSDDK